MRKRIALLLAVIPLAAQQAPEPSAPPAAGQQIEGSVDLGLRWSSDPGGDLNSYRSVVNLDEGFRVFGADLRWTDPKRTVFDTLTLFAGSWGDPYNSLRVDAERKGAYRALFDYRNIDYFNYLPSFANPGIGEGVLLSQRGFDIHRRLWNTELELRPGKRVVPYFAFSRDTGDGFGVTPFVTNGNEYPVSTRIDDRTNNYRGGVRLEMDRWHVTLEQGGTQFRDDQALAAAGINPGNRTTPLLGRKLFLDGASQGYKVRGSSLYSRGLVTASPARWVDLHAQFLYSLPKSDADYSDDASGLFYLGATRFFNGLETLADGEAKQPHTSGSFSAEIRPHRRVRIHESLLTDRLHNAASLLLTQRLLFAGAQELSGRAFSTDRLVMNYNRQQADVFVDLTQRISLRGGHRYEWGDSQVRAGTFTLAPEPVPFERGELKRHVGLAGANWRPARSAMLNVDFEAASTERTYFRTSLYDYRKLRARSRFEPLKDLRVSLGVSWMVNENPSPGVEYDWRSAAASGSVQWLPGGGRVASVLGEYTWSSLRSDILFRGLPYLTQELSAYRDNAHTATALVDFTPPAARRTLVPRFSAGGSLFVSSGSRPSSYYRPLGSVVLPLSENVAWYAEWRWHGLSQVFYPFEGFRTHHLMTGIRLSR